MTHSFFHAFGMAYYASVIGIVGFRLLLLMAAVGLLVIIRSKAADDASVAPRVTIWCIATGWAILLFAFVLVLAYFVTYETPTLLRDSMVLGAFCVAAAFLLVPCALALSLMTTRFGSRSQLRTSSSWPQAANCDWSNDRPQQQGETDREKIL